jgi:uncharacterized RDD family membrane protein YckC
MYCRHCGAQLPEKSMFCPSCGTAIEEAVLLCLPASMGKRFVNYLIDYIGVWVFAIAIGAILAIIGVGEGAAMVAIFAMMLCGYHIFFEGIWARTPGKWITGTKVVRLDGTKPSFSQVVGRTFARLIPFEPFSFFSDPNPIGWHDSLTNTLVVSARCSAEDVAKAGSRTKTKADRTVLWIVLGAVGGIILVSILATILLASFSETRDSMYEADTLYPSEPVRTNS